jgi:hypothetical protein
VHACIHTPFVFDAIQCSTAPAPAILPALGAGWDSPLISPATSALRPSPVAPLTLCFVLFPSFACGQARICALPFHFRLRIRFVLSFLRASSFSVYATNKPCCRSLALG